TVKQAEMFAAIRAQYNIPRDPNLKLRDFPTLKHVIQFAYDRRPDLAAATVAPAIVTTTPEPAVAVAAAPADEDQIADAVLKIVAEKTGYPKDMLDVELDLEADLGIDTVKQAEMFAAIRAQYNIPRDPNLKLRDFPTLKHVIQFARDRAAAKPAAPAVPVEPKPSEKTTGPRPPVQSFEAANQVPRRVPVPVLRPPLELCKATGVTLGHGSRVVIMSDGDGVGSAITQLLERMGVEALQLERGMSPGELGDRLRQWSSTGPVHGVYWLPALDHEGPIGALELAAWHKEVQLRLKSLYTTMRSLCEQIAAPGVFLVSATRLGGQHGYDPA
ncbi:MAG: phosphopantetheine-binding protein, partial [Terriglobales bacterium]